MDKYSKALILVLVATAGIIAAADVTGRVVSASSFCGNSVCEVGEGPVDCPQDCISICGDFICQGSEAITCKQDCTGARVVKVKEITLRDGMFG